MSKLSAYAAKVEKAENNLRDFLHAFFTLSNPQIEMLLAEIKLGAFTHVSEEEIWLIAFENEVVSSLETPPVVEISHLRGMWQRLRIEELNALDQWKSLCVTTT